ncbi:MAG: hypothetical protein ACRD5G_07615 [Candidatus Acidiferrales bacterium]
MTDQQLRDLLRQARLENLMILYVDAHSQPPAQTPWYDTPAGTLARRDVFTQEFLQKPNNRQHLLALFRDGIARLVQQARWRTLFWMSEQFPSRHLPNGPGAPLRELKGLIETACRRVRVGDHSGWEEIQQIPRDEADRQRRLLEAVEIIKTRLRASFGENEARRVFPSGLGQAFGQRMTIETSNWAAAVVQHVRALNRLRKGQEAYVDGTRPGADFRLPNHAVETARSTWTHHLTEGHREVLAQQPYWQTGLSRIWIEVKERINLGLRYASVPETAETFEHGRYRNPDQGLY